MHQPATAQEMKDSLPSQDLAEGGDQRDQEE